MSIIDQSQLEGKIRDKPIGPELTIVLRKAAEQAGIDVVLVTSGSQPGTTGRRTGSTRHDNGRAADLKLIVDGRALRFTDKTGGNLVEAFVAAAAANGAIGIGAGLEYMGPETLHVGFGLNESDDRKLVWGAKGLSVNAPAWLRQAAERGWAERSVVGTEDVTDRAGHGLHKVIARGGLHLRKGPGLEFGITTTLASGEILRVMAFDGASRDWARVDREGDGLVDGHAFAPFLQKVLPDDDEAAAEP